MRGAPERSPFDVAELAELAAALLVNIAPEVAQEALSAAQREPLRQPRAYGERDYAAWALRTGVGWGLAVAMVIGLMCYASLPDGPPPGDPVFGTGPELPLADVRRTQLITGAVLGLLIGGLIGVSLAASRRKVPPFPGRFFPARPGDPVLPTGDDVLDRYWDLPAPYRAWQPRLGEALYLLGVLAKELAQYGKRRRAVRAAAERQGMKLVDDEEDTEAQTHLRALVQEGRRLCTQVVGQLQHAARQDAETARDLALLAEHGAPVVAQGKRVQDQAAIGSAYRNLVQELRAVASVAPASGQNVSELPPRGGRLDQ